MRRQGLADEAETVGEGGCTPCFSSFPFEKYWHMYCLMRTNGKNLIVLVSLYVLVCVGRRVAMHRVTEECQYMSALCTV